MTAEAPVRVVRDGLQHREGTPPDVVHVVPDLPGRVVEEGHGRLQDQNVVVIGRAAHESASALDMVADLEAEALGEEGSGRLEIGRAEYGVAQLAWSDWGRSQYTGRAATRAHGTTGTVVRRGRDGLLRRNLCGA